MLTPKYARENADAIRKSLEKRRSNYPFDELLSLDEQLRKVNKELQDLRAERNRGSEQIAELKKAGKEADKALIDRLSQLKKRMDELEGSVQKQNERIDALMWNLPNILDKSVPVGESGDDNVEIRKWGEPKARKNAPSHEELLEKLGMLDVKQAAEVSGARFYYLKGDIALLEQSIIRFGIDELVKKGYTLIAPPLMLKRQYYKGMVTFGSFEEMLYRVSEPQEAKGKSEMERMEEELFLIATSEHAVGAMHANQVFSEKELPKKYAGISPCFRREAGAHGKDTKGIFRVHHFYKIEQFIFCKPEDSWKYFDELIANNEDLFKKLNIPYRVMALCGPEVGTASAKTYDTETFVPAQGKYREIGSCSNCLDWQAMRLNIRYDEGAERKYVHTLNATLVPTTRAIVSIVENYYNDDGTITVPDVLVPYMGKKTIGR
jgi:seryl-tRNA synthetase